MIPPVELLSLSPIRKLSFPRDALPLYRPFGQSTAENALNYFLGTPEIVTQVGNYYYILSFERALN